MSCDLPNTTFAVIDHGSFLPLARALARHGSRVIYHRPEWEKAFPTFNDAVIGDGFPEIEWCDDIWKVKSDVDVFVFPDIYHMGLQAELKQQGYPVWGAQSGMRLEINRQFFLGTLKDLGLDVPPFEVVVGISALRDHLKDRKDIFIKVSKFRGSWETTHWRSWSEDSHRLDLWAVRFGGIRERVKFLCFEKIDTNLEIGCDTFNIDGQWPERVLHGIEKKDCAYLSAVTEKSKMPRELTDVMDAFGPLLKTCDYRASWSMEVRVADSGNFFIDATTRCGLPSTGSQILAMKNLCEVIYHGANGELVQPEYEYQFTAECMVKINVEDGSWGTMQIPDELKDHLMVYDCCLVNGQPWFPSDEKSIEEVGWLVAAADSPVEVAKQMNQLADALPEGCDAAVESLADILREIEEEQESGIKFTNQKLPEPEVVLEKS